MCEKIYYYRDIENKPVSTICIISENGWMARGVAICGPKDNFSRKTGRAIARGRAVKAIKSMQSGDRIKGSRKGGISILLKIPPDVDSRKSVFDPVLTDFEKKILGMKRVCGKLTPVGEVIQEMRVA